MENYRLIIRKKRKQLGLSQNQLARAVGISQPFMNEIELGKKSTSVEVLIKICEALDIHFLGQEKEDL